ncbi:hypothetical protein CLU79DRAFT_829208 [Phycomyces nitens]|nr:hypothetical protein CLU79DRAFT_829208 [Phycomyces nitens]
METNPDTSQSQPTCAKCHDQLRSQSMGALGKYYHVECFTCTDCDAPVGSNFFPYTAQDGQTFPLCERDYFEKLGLICVKCHEPLRGSYINALDKKYHIDHFTCSACPVAFGPEDSYYEHNGQVFCHFHYSIQFAVMCAGCEMAILKQYVEIDRNDEAEHWHPECYMIHKYWNVRIAQPSMDGGDIITQKEQPPQNQSQLLQKQHDTEEKVFRIWQVLSAFEESSALCISEMLLHVSNGSYINGICISERFLVHVEALFSGIDDLLVVYNEYRQPEFKYTREAKMLCKKIINFFSLMWKTQEVEMRKLGISQELLSLITGLAHYLKILIKVALTAALRLDITVGKPVAVSRLLAKLMEVAGKERHSRDSQRLVKSKEATDCCYECKLSIEDQCIKYGQFRWHIRCFTCHQCKRSLVDHTHLAVFNTSSHALMCTRCSGSKGDSHSFEYVTKLVQYAFLLRVALSRLCSLLHITDQQLSAIDYSTKTKIQAPKDALGKDIVTHTVEKQQVVSQYVNEKSLQYPTYIDTSMISATKPDRKMSRSFKTAKRSTIIGNTNKSIMDDSESRYNRPAPARSDSLVRLSDQNKELPPIPTHGSTNKTRHRPQKSIGLDDLPQFAALTVAEQAHSPVRATSTQLPPMAGRMLAPHATKPRIYLSELSALQYMIIRHVAVVHIEPYVREYFTLGELLNMIELKKASIWGKFFTSFRNGGGRKAQKGKEEGTFGVPIDVLTEKTGVESNLGAGPSPIKIAGFLDDAITAMRQKDMSVEGVFRKNGNIRRLKELTEQLDKHPHDVDLTSENVIQIAALLKKFLRELPDPLLTFKLHGLFTCAQKIANPCTRKHVLHLACCMLPRCNRDTLEVLVLFLRWVASFSHVTTDVGSRMDIPNLARVIAPNILTTDSKDPVKDDSFSAIGVVEILLESCEDFCLVPEELEPFLQDPSLADATTMDISSKEFLKKVEQMMKHKKQSQSTTSIPPSFASSTDLRLFDGLVDGQHLPPTSIYTQQQFLPYSNRHPSSDFYPNTLSRQANLRPNNMSHSSLSSMNSYHHNNSSGPISPTPPYAHSPLNSAQHVTSQ